MIQLTRPNVGMLFLALMPSACGPSVKALTARPNVVCQGTGVELAWEASQPGTLSAKNPVAVLGDVAATGTMTVRPVSTTTYRLEVHNVFGSDSREVDVDVRQGGASKLIGQSVADPATVCTASALTVAVDLTSAFWGGDVAVAAVGLPDGGDRAVTVRHGAREAALSPQARRSDALRGLPAVGRWELSTPLASGEQCGTPKIPRSLAVTVELACGL